MGCDIHIYTEKKVNDKWELADPLVKNEYFGLITNDNKS